MCYTWEILTFCYRTEFSALPVWCSQTLPTTTGRDRASRARGSFPLCTKCCSQTNERVIWPGNETSCAHAYKIRKWRPSQRTATTECCEWLLLTRVNSMKTLSGWEAVRCDEHPFRAKMKVSA